jgi:LPXTG-motif cell wall-anchored protein
MTVCTTRKSLFAGVCGALLAAAGLLILPAAVYGYRVDLPPEVEARPEPERTAWLNQHLEDAYTVQMRVAQERYDQRMAQADALVSQMAARAVAIERETNAQGEEPEGPVSGEDGNIALIALGGALTAFLGWLVWRARGDLSGVGGGRNL